jgi:hypothetical protein
VYPAQTSLIPTQIALARFWETGGNILGHYPYWYFGTTPYQYLTGPLVPGGLSLLHNLLPFLSLFDLMWWFIGVSWVWGAVGVGLLATALGTAGFKKTALVAAGAFGFGALAPIFFPFSNGLSYIAFSWLPWVWLSYLKYLRFPSWKRAIQTVGLLIVFWLLSTDQTTSLLVGFLAIMAAETDWRQPEAKIKQLGTLLLSAFLIVSCWYTLGYWLTIVRSPSFAGRPLFQVFFDLIKLIPVFLAFSLAIRSSRNKEKPNKLANFTFYWLVVFGSLTLIRFLSDPDFWQDWFGYHLELQLGLALLIANWWPKVSHWSSRALAISGYILLFVLVFNRHILGKLQQNLSDSVEYRISKQLMETAKPGQTVLLSGSTVFWLNAFSDIAQVRGGNDRTSIDRDWRGLVWEAREGEDPALAYQLFLKKGVDFIVVHTAGSDEYYHDFRFPDKWEKAVGFTKVWEGRGDRIYQVGQ